MKRLKLISTVFLAAFISVSVVAQEEDFAVEVDSLLYRDDLIEEEKQEPRQPKKEFKLNEVSSLKFLSPFKDIAIIQKKYLAKTERFELSPGLGVILNDAFFVNQILSFRFGYHFNESYGIELNYANLSQSSKTVTDDLTVIGVTTDSIVVPESFLGLDFKWTPFYGKMSFLDASIIPYETYFVGGVGTTKTNQEKSPVTAHFALGQHFSLSKSLAIRWDTSFFWYQAQGKNTTAESLYTNIHFTIGASYFFPEATYR